MCIEVVQHLGCGTELTTNLQELAISSTLPWLLLLLYASLEVLGTSEAAEGGPGKIRGAVALKGTL